MQTRRVFVRMFAGLYLEAAATLHGGPAQIREAAAQPCHPVSWNHPPMFGVVFNRVNVVVLSTDAEGLMPYRASALHADDVQVEIIVRAHRGNGVPVHAWGSMFTGAAKGRSGTVVW